jgi:hypothetical protein
VRDAEREEDNLKDFKDILLENGSSQGKNLAVAVSFKTWKTWCEALACPDLSPTSVLFIECQHSFMHSMPHSLG